MLKAICCYAHATNNECPWWVLEHHGGTLVPHIVPATTVDAV
jgi:hypothetical protein